MSGGDTLKIKRHYRLKHPQYSPDRDTLQSAATRKSSAISENGLDAVGSITRGIQISTNSSISLQSSMYLKIKGNLSEEYTVEGVLTDKTSPLQPIGNTRRLNDFERVMVQIDGPRLNATIGDIDLRLQHGKFGKMDRSIEGLSIHSKSGLATLSAAIGFSYGKYHLIQIQGKNGKQGPYRLSGKNGEKFIIILAGSEKIKLDDHLLIRGEDEDYIIDYNAAEIQFTQQHILSANSRISVEFEYVPDIYLSSYSFGKQLISGGISLGDRENSDLFISASWQDIRDDQNNPLGNIDSDQLREIFGNLDHNTGTTEISGIVRDTLQGDYNLSDIEVLVYQGENLGEYLVDFTFVGLDRGQYRKVQDVENQYFIFDSEFGEYLPAQQYGAPGSQFVFSLSGHGRKAGVGATFDVAVSQDTKNLYASDLGGSKKVAWDINTGVNLSRFEVFLGDRYYESGFITHDALESLEFYRLWQLSLRQSEAEHLSYGHLRLGKQNYLKSTFSQMERSGIIAGHQLQLEAESNPSAPLSVDYSAVVTRLDTTQSQKHNFKTQIIKGKLTTRLNLNLEDGSRSSLYAANDHFSSGGEAIYQFSQDHNLSVQYDRRFDFRFSESNQSFLTSATFEEWSDKRQDWITKYDFKDFMNSRGQFKLKYREHQSDSGNVKKYYLGTFNWSGSALNNRIKFQEHYVLDEEHIPKYDYHYIEVDTGYGDYSFDPVIKDYIPIHGGRYVRQRLFSDREEQVRKYENKTRFEYSSKDYGTLDKIAIKSRFGYETRLKQEVQSNTSIQSQSLLSLKFDLQTGQTRYFTKLGYAGKKTSNHSTLYNYGSEENNFSSHGLEGDFNWNTSNQTRWGLVFETRERELEYNPLALEHWVSMRTFMNHSIKYSPQQKLGLDLTISRIDDKQVEKEYSEVLGLISHTLRIKRRGRIDQQLSLSRIQADIQAIPYSVFSGRQPGDNLKYTLNGRYTFSSMFQVSLNYSIQQRGAIQSEQYLRIEGRTHF